MFQNNLLMGAAAASSGGASVVSVGNSALFDSANSEYLSRTPSGAGSSTTTWTMSFWVYRARLGSSTGNGLFSCTPATNTSLQVYFNTTDTLKLHYILSTTDKVVLETTQKFRDIGWYHICVVADTSNAVANNRVRFIVNGERVTAFSTETQNSGSGNNIAWNASSTNHVIGVILNTSAALAWYADFYLAEVVFLDGTASTGGSEFAEYDSSGLYWTPKSSDDIKTLTFGTNGFYLDNTTNAQTDASGEGNSFTNNNTVTTNTHTPTNISALLNPLMSGSTGTFSSGNRTATLPPVNTSVISSMPIPSTGKWYCEFRFATIHGYAVVGVSQMDASSWLANSANYISTGPTFTEEGTLFTEGTTSGDAVTVTTDTTYGAMWDADNSILKITDGTDTYQCAYTVNNTSVPLGFQFAISSGSVTGNVSVNFGDPPFAISSGNADGNGQGNFEFAVPSGYLALNTANIASATTRTASDTNKYFQTVLYEGNGAGQRVGAFQPFTDTYTIAKSALFNSDNSEYFNRTFGSGGDTTDWGYSIWYKYGKETTDDYFLSAGVHASTTFTRFMFDTGGGSKASFDFTTFNSSGSVTGRVLTTQEFEDASIWNHILITWDSDNSTAGDRMRMYVNGNRVTVGTFTNPSSGEASRINVASAAHMIGSYNAGASGFADGYMADVAFIDGFNAAGYGPANFGQTDTSTNKWVPKDISGLTYANTSFRLDFSNGSDLGEDQENSNDWTNNNTVTQTTDSPTTNITVLSPNRNLTAGTTSNGNRTVVTGSSQYGPIWTEMALSSGKWYWEAVVTADTSASLFAMFGITTGTGTSTTQQLGYLPYDIGYYSATYDGGGYYINNVKIAAIGDWTLNDVMGCALDFDAMTLTFYKNNTSKAVVDLPSEGPYYPAFCDWDNSSTCTWVTRFASADWSYSAPTDHVAITQDNMTSTDQFISAFSWIRNRDATANYMLFDRVRGVTKDIHSNTADIEVTNAQTVQQFLSAGVQIGNDAEVNTANQSYVLWNWMMEATGSGSSNEDGSINTTSTLVDTTLGMSISKYTGTGSNATVGHGLGVAPKMMLIKNLGVTDAWAVYYGDNTDYIVLNSYAATVDDVTMWNDTTPTSSVFSIGSNHQVNASSENYIAYCFAPSQFISIGSYEGNGNADGTFAPLLNSLGIPIKPVWSIFKNIDNGTSGSAWSQEDTARSPTNVMDKVLSPSSTYAEGNWADMDFVTGGIKQRGTNLVVNQSAKTIIYMAIGTPIIDTDGRIIAGR